MLKKLTLAISFFVSFNLIVINLCHAKDNEGKAVLNADITSTLASARGKLEISGRMSAFLRLDPADYDRGRVKVGAFNLLYTGVPQVLISGRKSDTHESGNLGFAINVSEKGQFLEYNPQDLTLSGIISGNTSISQFEEIFQARFNEKEHDIDGLTQAAKLQVKIQLEKPLDLNIGSEKTAEFKAKMDMDINVQADRKYQIDSYRISSSYIQELKLELNWWYQFEVAKRLCIQPVRIGSLKLAGGWPPVINVSYSGDGLAFGMPGTKKEWSKADVVFSVRDWKTIFNYNYSTLSLSESSSLFAEVNDDDCVEVYFVDKFSPNDMWGGGATTAGGTANTKIISSDENADFGIDETHLAHEVGHAITLKHPGSGFPNASAPHRVDGSTGTLMCPSGFMNDNPKVNSQWNKDNIQNPLLTFAIKLAGPDVDCQNDADCGACP